MKKIQLDKPACCCCTIFLKLASITGDAAKGVQGVWTGGWQSKLCKYFRGGGFLGLCNELTDDRVFVQIFEISLHVLAVNTLFDTFEGNSKEKCVELDAFDLRMNKKMWNTHIT